MSKPKGPDGADPMAAAEGQAAVEAIAETEGQTTTTDAKPRRRKPKAVENAAGAESPASTDASIAAAGTQADAIAAAGSDLVPVMAPEETVRAESVTITQGGASHVEAGTLSVTQGGVGDARADRIEVRQGGVGRAEVDELVVTQGGVGIVRAEHASISQGGVGAVIGDRIDLHQSAARLVIARGSVRIQQALAQTVMARDVEIGERGFAGLVLARTVTGQGRILFDWRAGLALGAAFGLVWGVLRGLRR